MSLTSRTGGILVAALALAAVSFSAASAQEVPSQADWADARQTLTTADGLDMTYVQFGSEDGMPLVLLHGYSDNSRSWSLLAPHLGDRPMIALDLRGHGGSAAPDCCYDPATLANDVAGAMDALGIDSADVAAHSLGSMTAAIMAANHPDRVNRLVLVSSGTRIPDAALDWLWSEVPALPDQIDPNGEFMMAWYWNPNPVDEDFLSRERAESAAVPRQAWMGVLRGLSVTDWSYMGAQIDAPALALWGDQDGLFGSDSQDALKAALPGLRHETYEGYGHNMLWETPETTGAMIRAFLDE